MVWFKKKPLIFLAREYKRIFPGKINDFVDRILKITGGAHASRSGRSDLHGVKRTVTKKHRVRADGAKWYPPKCTIVRVP